jgi:hypothetical protein
MESGYLPLGATYDKAAPYNEEEIPVLKVKTIVQVILSKEVELEVDDYDVLLEEVEGEYYPHWDFKNCNLKKAAAEQLELPEDLDSWELDNFEVILNQ